MKFFWVYATGERDVTIDLIKFANKNDAGETYALLTKHGKAGVRAGMIRKGMTEQEAVAYVKEYFPNHNVVVKE